MSYVSPSASLSRKSESSGYGPAADGAATAAAALELPATLDAMALDDDDDDDIVVDDAGTVAMDALVLDWGSGACEAVECVNAARLVALGLCASICTLKARYYRLGYSMILRPQPSRRYGCCALDGKIDAGTVDVMV